MEITFQKEDGCQKYYSVEAPWTELEPRHREVVKALKSHARMPGFRPGKAPESMLRGRFHKEIREEILEHFLPEAAKSAVEKFALKPLVDPYAEAVAFEEGQAFKCTLIVEEAPPVPAVSAEGISIEAPKAEVKDEQVQKVLESLRQRAAVMKPLEASAGEGDFVVATLLKKGQVKPFERFLCALPQSEDAAERAVVGLKAGDGVDLEVKAEAHDHDHDHEHDHEHGHDHEHAHLAPGSYRLTVTKVARRELPDLNDDFAKDMGADNIEALRAQVRQDVEGQVQRDVRAIQEDRLIEALLEKHKFPVPPTLVERQLKRDVEELAEGLARRGADLNKASVNWEEVFKGRRPVAERKVAAYFLLESVTEKAGLTASEEEVNAYFAAKAQGTGVTPEKLKAYSEKEDQLGGIRQLIAHKKALALLLSQASVTFTEGKSTAQEEPNAPDPHSR